MKILRYERDGRPHYGVMDANGKARELIGSPFSDYTQGRELGDPDGLKLLAPVEPSKVIGVGLNYRQHVEEIGSETPKVPMLFLKPPSAVIGQAEPIVYPSGAKVVHFEGELAVVIGKPARHVSERDALQYVLGYTCGNDVSDRQVQAREMETGVLLLGKGYDTFCPLGPAIATGLDPTDLQLEARINGVVKQRSSTADLLFSVSELIAYATRFFTLLPGDVIMTGTPSGIGPIVPGDIVEIEIDGVGVLTNPVVAEG